MVSKDLTFIHLGNESTVEGLVNFEKLRMLAKEIRALTNMCSAPLDIFTMMERQVTGDERRAHRPRPPTSNGGTQNVCILKRISASELRRGSFY